MSTRREVAERKEAMLEELREAYRLGVALPGQMAVSQRELSGRFGLSLRTVALEMQKLVDEGVLYIVPRVGTFVGRPSVAQPDCYLLALPRPLTTGGYSDYVNSARRGFEERIAELGGSTITLSIDVLHEYALSGHLPSLSGVFEWTDLRFAQFLPEPDGAAARERLTASGALFHPAVGRVRFGRVLPADAAQPQATSDAVDFDNVAGGEQCAKHLIEMGHSRIAFLGLHGSRGNSEVMHWSLERAQGWKRALETTGYATEDLAFLPECSAGILQESQRQAASEAAARLVRRRDITAVIAVNELAGYALLDELKSLSPDVWPAVVCFDDFAPNDEHILSSLILPFGTLGRTAADLLWERHHGRLTGAPQQRVVPMRLVRRLSCRQDWTRAGARTLLRPVPALEPALSAA